MRGSVDLSMKSASATSSILFEKKNRLYRGRSIHSVIVLFPAHKSLSSVRHSRRSSPITNLIPSQSARLPIGACGNAKSQVRLLSLGLSLYTHGEFKGFGKQSIDSYFASFRNIQVDYNDSKSLSHVSPRFIHISLFIIPQNVEESRRKLPNKVVTRNRRAGRES